MKNIDTPTFSDDESIGEAKKRNQRLTTLPLFQENKKPKSHYAFEQSREVKELMATCSLYIRDKFISCILFVLARKNWWVYVLEERHLFEGTELKYQSNLKVSLWQAWQEVCTASCVAWVTLHSNFQNKESWRRSALSTVTNHHGDSKHSKE